MYIFSFFLSLFFSFFFLFFLPFFFFIEATKNEKQINDELIARVRSLIGPIASFRIAAAVSALPRTRSGKIIRKSIANLARSRLFKVNEFYGKL